MRASRCFARVVSRATSPNLSGAVAFLQMPPPETRPGAGSWPAGRSGALSREDESFTPGPGRHHRYTPAPGSAGLPSVGKYTPSNVHAGTAMRPEDLQFDSISRGVRWDSAPPSVATLPPSSPFESLDPNMLVTVQERFESATEQLAEAHAQKRRDVDTFRAEMARGSLTDPLEVQQWANVLAADETKLEQATVEMQLAEEAMTQASEALRLQQSAAGQRAHAQKQLEALNILQSRYSRYNTEADETQQQALAARMQLARTVSGNPRLSAWLSAAGDHTAASTPPPSSSTQGATLASLSDAIPEASRSDQNRSFYSLLHSPRTLQLGEKAEVRGPSGTISGSTSLFCLLPGQFPRSWAILVAESKAFDPIVLLTILANCMTMAWESPLDPPGTSKAAFIDTCEWVFLGIFTLEMLIKILAYGFLLHKGAYLRDAWCQMDFVVVSLAWLPILYPDFGNYSALRAVRALRPLRALKRLPGMPVLIKGILMVMPKLATVLLLCGFIFLIFGIVGLELFKGALHYRCALPDSSAGRMLKGAKLDNLVGGDTGIICNPADTTRCEQSMPGSTCTFFEENPLHDMESFDSIPMTLVQLMQSVTFDEWATPMYDLSSYYSPWVSAYFLLIVGTRTSEILRLSLFCLTFA